MNRSLQKAHQLEQPQVASYYDAFLDLLRIEVCSFWRDSVSSCGEHTLRLRAGSRQIRGPIYVIFCL